MKPGFGKVVSGDLDDHNDPNLQVYSHILKEEVLLQHFQIFGFIQMRSNKGQKEIKGKCLKNILGLRNNLLIFPGVSATDIEC